jgi:hypothetical protein
MSILKALQKKRVEPARSGSESPGGTIVSLDRVERENAERRNRPRRMFVG